MHRLLSLACGLALGLAAPGARAETYHVIDIGVPEEFTDSFALGINASGLVVGSLFPGPRAFQFRVESGFQLLDPLTGGDETNARDVNDAGVVVGDSNGVFFGTGGLTVAQRAVRWTAPASPVALESGGGDLASARAINANGSAAGFDGSIGFPTGGSAAALWSPEGIAIDLDPPAGGSRSAHDLNDSGQLVGVHTPSLLDARAFRWSVGTGFVELLGLDESHRAVGAFGIDSAGVAVGSSGEFSSTKHATRWVAADAPEDLGTLPGDDSSEALAIADDGSVVGWSNGPLTGQRAIVWTAADGMLDLNALSDADALGMTLEMAHAINAAGQIVGSGRVGSSVRAFLATPVPEAAGSAPAWAVLACLARLRRGARLRNMEAR